MSPPRSVINVIASLVVWAAFIGLVTVILWSIVGRVEQLQHEYVVESHGGEYRYEAFFGHNDATFHGVESSDQTLNQVVDALIALEVHTLCLDETGVTPAGIGRLSRLKHLRNLSMTGPGITDVHLARVAKLRVPIASIKLHNTQVSPVGVTALYKLKHLRHVSMTGDAITDSHLASAAKMRNLYVLILTGSSISDAGLENLKSMPHLARLGLAETQLTGKGLKHLTGARHLTSLHLEGTSIDDLAVDHVSKLSSLDYLTIWDTHLSSEATERLRRALPECSVVSVVPKYR